jgi:hypothetical protein
VFAFVAPDEIEADGKAHAALDPWRRSRSSRTCGGAFRQGTDAYVQDHLICASDWADLHPRLTRPTRIWQGTEDANVPAQSTRWMAERIPGPATTTHHGHADMPRIDLTRPRRSQAAQAYPRVTPGPRRACRSADVPAASLPNSLRNMTTAAPAPTARSPTLHTSAHGQRGRSGCWISG